MGVLLVNADLDTVTDAFRRADVTLLTLGTGAFFASLLLSSLRWRAFLRPLGINLDTLPLIRLYLAGTFFNAFLPTGFGGDAYKAIVLGRGMAAIEGPLASALLDRSAGLAGLGVLTLVGAAIDMGAGGGAEPVWVASAVAAGLLATGCVTLVLAGRSTTHPVVGPVGGRHARIRTFIQAVGVGVRHPGGMRSGALWGIITALLLVIAHGFLLRAVDIRIPLGDIAGIVLLAALTTVVPLSINGLGFREATYIWMLGAYGVSHDIALVFALVVLGVTLLTSAVGGIVYAISEAPLPRRVEDVQDRGDDQEVDTDQQRPDTHQYRRG